MSKIAIIGGGNLGQAIAEGLLRSKFCKASDITVTRRNPAKLDYLSKKGVQTGSDNKSAVKNANIVLLCVKPFQAKEVLKELSKIIHSKQILVSAVSGVSIADICELLSAKPFVMRAMPNTAMAIGESMTCLSSANNGKECKVIERLFNALGKTIFIDEKLMDASTVLGACGTALAMRYIRANIQAGIEIGFDAATARLIAAQTVKGAADLLLENGTHPEEEIDKVTTPKGVTITGLNQMEHHGLSSSVIKGITEAFKKIS